jgi:hypothetical protein
VQSRGERIESKKLGDAYSVLFLIAYLIGDYLLSNEEVLYRVAGSKVSVSTLFCFGTRTASNRHDTC